PKREDGPVSVLNVDDERICRLREQIPGRVLTVGLGENTDYRASDIRYAADSTSFRMQVANSLVDLETHLVGPYNVSNVLGAVAMCHALGISLDDIRNGLSALETVPGRLEPVREGQDFLVVVDYAHTPDALERVLQNARQMTQNRVIAVFGCGGDRDSSK